MATRDPGDEQAHITRIAWGALAGAPRRARLALLAQLLLLGAAFAFSLLRSPDRPHDTADRASLVLGAAGLLLWTLAFTLHRIGQQSAVQCKGLSFRLQSRVLHRATLAVPLLGLVAAIFIAAALGVSLAGSRGRPADLVLAGAWSFVLLVIARGVNDASRFLYGHAREQAEAAARARGEAVEAQLGALQSQLNPHFLFNTLNTVASLIRTDARAAEATVENLAQVLRRTLDDCRHTTRSLADEVDYTKAYLAIEQERWRDRLRVVWSIDPAALALAIPPMTLQPLVENAIKHGVAARIEGGALEVRAERANGTLSVAVSDDGLGFPARFKEGTGIANLRRRLLTLYGDRSALLIERPARGARVVVTLPATAASRG